MSDITIDGDVKHSKGSNIFQLNQTYLEKSRLNIGPKGFTGEKYGGSTYWDTEAYCIPFYMATKDQEVARNLLTYIVTINWTKRMLRKPRLQGRSSAISNGYYEW
jgi:maltose phosphorylase